VFLNFVVDSTCGGLVTISRCFDMPVENIDSCINTPSC